MVEPMADVPLAPAAPAVSPMTGTWRKVGYTFVARSYSLLASLVVLAITARYLGPSGRGIIAAAMAWATLGAVAGGLSLGQVVTFHAAGRPPSQWLPAAVRALLTYLASATVAIWLAGAIAYAATDGNAFQLLSPTVFALALLAVPLLMWTEYATSLFAALDALPVANLTQALASTVNVALVPALLLWLDLGIHAPLLATVGAGGVALWVSLLYLRRSVSPWVASSGTLPKLLRGGLKLHANAVGTYLFTYATTLVVSHYLSAAETGIYSLALQLLMVANIFPMSVGMVAYSLVGRHGANAAWREQRRLLLQAQLVTAVMAVLGYALAPFSVELVAGRDFLAAVPLFRILLLSLFGMTMSSVMASQWIGRGLFVQAASITIATGLLNFLGALYLVPRFGTAGAAWATVAVYVVAIVGNGLFAAWVHGQSAAAAARYVRHP